MKHINLPIKSLRIREGESFTLKVEEFGDDREVFVLFEKGRLTFGDESHHEQQPDYAVAEMTQDGWRLVNL